MYSWIASTEQADSFMEHSSEEPLLTASDADTEQAVKAHPH